jgi:hypothetical protein
VFPLVWNRRLLEDGFNRADRLASSAVDALLRIDVQLIGKAIVRGTDVFIDAVHRARIDA